MRKGIMLLLPLRKGMGDELTMDPQDSEDQPDLCPVCTLSAEANVQNHLLCIKEANLGPADPRQPSQAFWDDKANKWQVQEGEARSRLCMNCEHYENTQENQDCILSGPGAKVLASQLPVEPKWADIPGVPLAVCSRYNITCSSIRTCDDWEPTPSCY